MNKSIAAHQYGAVFYRYQREGSLRSAQKVLPVIHDLLAIRSVLDVGCGAGAWLKAHGDYGVRDSLGVDGDYVDRQVLLIESERFLPQDITRSFDLGRHFDLVQCLEVAEHVPGDLSSTLVDNITRHGRLVLFSAAVPGQGGEDHINERSYGYWRDLFAARGFRLFDFVRRRIEGIDEVEFWYRYNLLFFAHDSAVDELPTAIQSTRIADTAPVPDVSPWPYRARKALLRPLPVSIVTRLARWKHHRVIRRLNDGQHSR